MKKSCLILLAIFVAVLLWNPLNTQAASKVTFEFSVNDAGDGAILTRVYGDPSGTLTIPSTYKGLPVRVIANLGSCSNVTSLIIPEGVKIIESGVFGYMPSLRSLTLPSTLESFGHNSFVFSEDVEIRTYGGAKYLGGPNNPYFILIGTTSDDLTSYEIHPWTKIIAGQAFASCKNKIGRASCRERVSLCV